MVQLARSVLTELSRCLECGGELLVFDDARGSERCEDCRPETGPGSRLAEQLGRKLHQLRIRAGIERAELESRSKVSAGETSRVEGEDPPEPRTMTLLRLCHSLGPSIDEVTGRIYWNPAEVNLRNGDVSWLSGEGTRSYGSGSSAGISNRSTTSTSRQHPSSMP